MESHGSNRDLTVAHLQRGLNSGTSNGVIVLPSAEPLHREKDSLAVYIDANLFARDVILVAGERRLLARPRHTVRAKAIFIAGAKTKRKGDRKHKEEAEEISHCLI